MHAFYSYSDFMSVGMNGSLIQKLLEKELKKSQYFNHKNSFLES